MCKSEFMGPTGEEGRDRRNDTVSKLWVTKFGRGKKKKRTANTWLGKSLEF